MGTVFAVPGEVGFPWTAPGPRENLDRSEDRCPSRDAGIGRERRPGEPWLTLKDGLRWTGWTGGKRDNDTTAA